MLEFPSSLGDFNKFDRLIRNAENPEIVMTTKVTHFLSPRIS